VALKIDIVVFWFVTPCSVADRHHHFGGPCCLNLRPEDGVLPQSYTASQHTRPPLERQFLEKLSNHKLFKENIL
jgi:hypothetical protein